LFARHAVELLLIRREISRAMYGKRKHGSMRAKKFGLITQAVENRTLPLAVWEFQDKLV